MTEKQKPASDYYEHFDFPQFVAAVSDDERAVAEEIYHDDVQQDHQIRVAHLVKAVQAANTTLAIHGYIDADVIFGEGRMLPDMPMRTFDADNQESNLLEHALDPTARLVSGRYKGIAIMREELDESGVNRPQLLHRMQLARAEITTPFVEQVTDFYAYLPIDNEHIDVFRPTFARLPNQKALRSLMGNLFDTELNPDLRAYESIFQRLLTANFTKVSSQKNVDWLLDEFQQASGMMEHHVTIATGGCLIQSGQQSIYRADSGTVEGTFVGFCTIPTYTIKKLSDGRSASIEHDDRPQLALCLEIEKDGHKALAKVPINAILTDTPGDEMVGHEPGELAE